MFSQTVCQEVLTRPAIPVYAVHISHMEIGLDLPELLEATPDAPASFLLSQALPHSHYGGLAGALRRAGFL
ncbi:hypothetical protein AXA88_26870 [Salmonella enterica]|nr:hypothetical protein [Salmonella enterica]EGW6282986.1 hypothetical protein [Salmonella enterica]EGX3935402.1 hypothetical protein [Salmonella enterica]